MCHVLLLDAFKVSGKLHSNNNSSTYFGLIQTKWCLSSGMANKIYRNVCQNLNCWTLSPSVSFEVINVQYVSSQLHVCFVSAEYQTDLEFFFVMNRKKIDTMDDKRMSDSPSGASFRLSASKTWTHWPVILKWSVTLKLSECMRLEHFLLGWMTLRQRVMVSLSVMC